MPSCRRAWAALCAALVLTFPVDAESGEREGQADELSNTTTPSLDEENARLRAEIAALTERLHLPPIADGQASPARAGPSAALGGAGAAPPPGVSMAAMEKALAAVRAARAALLKYYDGDAAMLDTAPSFAAADDTLLTARMGLAALGMREPVLVGGGLGKARAFVVGVTGSSVSAGHDGFGPVAWPHVLARNMAPLWATLGVEFQLRDGAVGGRNPNPWPFCLKQIMGEDVDVVMREAEYWQWDAGFAPTAPIAASGRSRTSASFEVFLRSALSLPRRPAVHFLKLNHNTRANGMDFVPEYLGAPGTGSLQGAYSPPLKRFGINAFDAFGEPFNHLLARLGDNAFNRSGHLNWDGWPKPRPTKCAKPRSVSYCPVDPEKQDGYHKFPLDRGYDVVAHPEYERWYFKGRQSDLFVNWHPGPLGHEVIGNQLAYYHMGVLEQALAAIVAGGTAGLGAVAAKFKADGTAGMLPKAVACSETVCPISTSFAPQCAYSYLPKAQGPDVGDLMVNGTQPSGWVNGLADGQGSCNAGLVRECERCVGTHGCTESPTDLPCFKNAQKCSYLDLKRGQRGDASSGPITLGFENMFQCLIWIGESYYEWVKPRTLVNWAHEMTIKVDGKPCSAPHCTVVKEGRYVQQLQIDARGLIGGNCRRQRVDVTLEIKPAAPTAFDCDNKCEPSGTWSGYGGGLCEKASVPGQQGIVCNKKSRYTNASEVHTFISYAIAF